MSLIHSAAVGTAVGFIVKECKPVQNAFRKLAETPTVQRLRRRNKLVKDVETFIKDGDEVNLNRAATTAGVAAGTVNQIFHYIGKIGRSLGGHR